jgi:hypothetical protein
MTKTNNQTGMKKEEALNEFREFCKQLLEQKHSLPEQQNRELTNKANELVRELSEAEQESFVDDVATIIQDAMRDAALNIF